MSDKPKVRRCQRCHREGTRGFEADKLLPLCVNVRACFERQKKLATTDPARLVQYALIYGVDEVDSLSGRRWLQLSLSNRVVIKIDLAQPEPGNWEVLVTEPFELWLERTRSS